MSKVLLLNFEIICLLACTIQGVQQSPFCPLGWTREDHSCYLLHTSDRQTWPNAVEFCKRHHGYLVEINSKEEQNFLSSALRNSPYNGDLDDLNVWIGATDDVTENTWMWVTSETVLSYVNWRDGEPDEHSGQNEDCAAMSGRRDFRWQDDDCHDDKLVICEAPTKIPTTTASTTTTTQFDFGLIG